MASWATKLLKANFILVFVIIAATSGCDFAEDNGAGNSGQPTTVDCAAVTSESPHAASLEDEVVQLVNQRRAAGADCGSAGVFGASPPVSMNSALRCAARLHTFDMVTRNFFDHNNPDGQDPFVRISGAGYSFSVAAENIAAGDTTATEVMQGWMASDGHCANIMDPKFTHIGVGFALGQGVNYYETYWTQTFGAP